MHPKTILTTTILLVWLAKWASAIEPARRETLSEFTITPAATGEQLVRASIPLRPGARLASHIVVMDDRQRSRPAAIRPLAWQNGEAAGNTRRAIVTFPYTFADQHPVAMTLLAATREANEHDVSPFPVSVERDHDGWTLRFVDGVSVRARPIWPAADLDAPWCQEIVERNEYYRWTRWIQRSAAWARIVEFRADAVGQVIAVAHLQRREGQQYWLPRFGWDLEIREGEPTDSPAAHRDDRGLKLFHSFAARKPHRRTEYKLPRCSIGHPAAPYKRRGAILVDQVTDGLWNYRYLRSDGEDRVPLQSYAWRRAEFVVSPRGVPLPRPTLTSPHWVQVAWQDWDALYGTGAPLEPLDVADLRLLTQYHQEAMLASAAVGADWGNVTGYRDGQQSGTVFGMNRLNHCPAIFFEAMRSANRQLTETALAWCDNFYDLTIWWGPAKSSRPNTRAGGTRYNNLRATNETPPEDDWSYMWRGDKSKTFCTKGYDSFWLAYAETGDPRMLEALEAQLDYAIEHVHCDDGECRNIGDVADFVRLYEWSGQSRFLDQGLRLFRELRPKLSDDHLFDQRGAPIDPNPRFIDDDEVGKQYPFAKPYILGYALAGCPRLASYVKKEPRLKEMVFAVADFLADSQDPLGGWRYPHPQSSRMIASQALEHAWQLMQASELLDHVEGEADAERRNKYLDAIERTLKLRLWVWKSTGKIPSNLYGWESSSGKLKDPDDIYQRYRLPADRERARDYLEGRLGLGGSAPEGIVYFTEVLRYYLKQRSADGLIEAPDSQSPLGKVLSRISESDFEAVGVTDGLPAFRDPLASRLQFPLAWRNAEEQNFADWQTKARAHVMAALQRPPPEAPFAPVKVGSRQYAGYTSHKITFNLTGDSRVPAYLVVPEGRGPFPALLLLHDHGAEFRIGKEKVVEPWAEGTGRQELARAWTDAYYGGRFLGDELARRGYVCLAVDALNWSDRGGADFDGQQALASNLLHLGSSLAGRIAHEDLRAARFLASRPEVDASRVAALGLSMGAFRTWQLAALSEDITAGAAICWMATVKGLMVPGNNHTQGHSAFTMLHPGLFRAMDYPDVASLACPKAMLFYNGRRDHLFPVASVEEAYQQMRGVWKSQDADGRLVTKLWDVPHEFNLDMQEEAFNWLDAQLAAPRPD